MQQDNMKLSDRSWQRAQKTVRFDVRSTAPQNQTATLVREARQSLERLRTSSLQQSDMLCDVLRKGFQFTTLNTVEDQYLDLVVVAKSHIGVLINFLNCLGASADTRHLLHHISLDSFPQPGAFSESLSIAHRDMLVLCTMAGSTVTACAQGLPYYRLLKEFLEFDLAQILQSFRYANLILRQPTTTNPRELSLYGPHTIGLLPTGMIDLMATPTVVQEELGRIRTVLCIGQRIGHISHVLTTFQRELAKGNVTNELISLGIEHNGWTPPSLADKIGLGRKSLYKRLRRQLEQEQAQLFVKLEQFASQIHTFDVSHYMVGLRNFHHLQEELRFFW